MKLASRCLLTAMRKKFKIKKINAVYVHAPDKSKDYREQQIDISYDLVGILSAAMLNDLQNGETA